MSYNIAVGTVGGGLWVGYNGGEKWRQIQGPIDPESNVRALALNPHDSQHLLASVDHDGIYQSFDGGKSLGENSTASGSADLVAGFRPA